MSALRSNTVAFILCLLPTVIALSQTTNAPASSLSGSKKSGKSALIPPIVPNIQFIFDVENDDHCPVLISATDGLIKDSNEGLATCGELNSAWFADSVKLARRTDIELVWHFRINQAFSKCVAKTVALKWNNKKIDRRKSHLTLDFHNGQGILTLNLSASKSNDHILYHDSYLGSGVGWCLRLR